jgi:hypothetical protein
MYIQMKSTFLRDLLLLFWYDVGSSNIISSNIVSSNVISSNVLLSNVVSSNNILGYVRLVLDETSLDQTMF